MTSETRGPTGDDALGLEIGRAAARLNEAVETAARAGLTVELTVNETRDLRAAARPMVVARIGRPVPTE